MIWLENFKDRPAVCIQNSQVKATFLPLDGAKMVSLIRLKDGKELLAVKPNKNYKVLTFDGDYVSSECSGFDDMFPTVDPYTPTVGAFKGITYPDHGETSRIPYDLKTTGGEIILFANSKLFDITYEKRVFINNDVLTVNYAITNNGENDFPFLWAGHIMLDGRNVSKTITPFDNNAPTEIMFAPSGVDTTKLAKDRLTGFIAKSGSAYKFYYTDKMSKGVFGVEYLDGEKLIFEVDENKLPYLGMWLNNGEFQDIYTITPEPCSVPYDRPDRAEQKGITSIIKSHSTFQFDFKIYIKEN